MKFISRKDKVLTSISAAFICNSPLHLYSALQAIDKWGLDIGDCILVLKEVNDKFLLPPSLESSFRWKKVVRIPPFPMPPRIKEKGFKKRVLQYKFFRKWQSELRCAIGCQYVFLCHNRQEDNKVIASYLNASELIWLEDGTLSYFLWQEERIVPPGKRKVVKKAAVKVVKADSTKKKPVASKVTKGTTVRKKPAASAGGKSIATGKKPSPSKVKSAVVKNKPGLSKAKGTVVKKKPVLSKAKGAVVKKKPSTRVVRKGNVVRRATSGKGVQKK